MRILRSLALLSLAVPAGLLAQPVVSARDAVMWSAILSAEDARPNNVQQMGPLAGGLRYPDPEMRRLAVRGLGRLERDTIIAPNARLRLVDLVSYALSDTMPAVRFEAANALAQVVQRGNAAAGRDSLLAHFRTEKDPRVRGMMAQSLGRFPAPLLPDIESTITQVAGDTALTAVLGAARGFESFYRIHARNVTASAEAVARLDQLARYAARGRTTPARADSAARVRRLAVATLVSARKLSPATMTAAFADADPQVRRFALLSLAAADSQPDRARLITQAFKDQSPMIRYEALRIYGLRLQAAGGCGPILQALSDRSAHVQLLGIDLLGGTCEAGLRAQADERLATTARQLAPAYGDRGPAAAQPSWHQPAHALVALARTAPTRADSLLPRFANHGTWWVRMYAARAAATRRNTRMLEQLAYDSSDNVREAAIRGLSTLSKHATDSAYIAALTRKDYQLQITAARALDSTPNPEPALAALNASLQRVTGENRETSRDARMALLRTIASLGTPAQASQIQLYLYDWDREIAAETARILARWGAAQDAAPTSLPYSRLPSLTQLEQFSRTRAVFHMRGGSTFTLVLRPFEAPTTVERFVRLASAGYFDGLTWHRVVPNFVVQGGSPGANEYWGDGPYARDELTTESHLRGTVSISTRGRDTGDGQLFFNLVDNYRLDHSYTIIGEISAGMDAVDAVLEGATIEKVEVMTQ